jgi:carbon storage regulator
VKLGIEAPQIVKVFRQEVYDAIQAENRRAAASSSTPELPLIPVAGSSA